jgi:plasmid stability protein
MEKVTVELPIGLKRSLRAIAYRDGISMSTVVRDALHAHLEQGPNALWPRSIGMASDGSFDVSKVDEYLAEHWLSFLLEEAGLPQEDRSSSKTSSD